MSKLVIFSDLHSHTFGPYSTVLPDGTNSRLQDAINVISKVREVAKTVDADAVIFTGDLFHERRHIVTQAFNKTYEAMSMFAVDRMPLLMIHGNHDQADRLGRHHALKAFSTFATVVDNAGWVEFQGKECMYDIFAVPYVENANHLEEILDGAGPNFPLDKKEWPKIFLGHMGVEGAKLGADFVYTNGNEPSVEDLPTDLFDAGFLGHFHLHQELAPNFWYVGAPLQHNWGDIGQPRGCMVYDTETKVGSHIPFEGVSPTFMEITSAEARIKRDDCSGNIVRVVSDKPWSEDDIEASRVALGALSLEVSGQKVDVNEAYEARLKIDPGASYDEMVAGYVQSGLVELEGLEEDWLIEVGHKILAKVSS